jgi:anti-sigma-K factor RskA
MATPETDPDMTAAELALGVLDGEERGAALRRVLADPAFAREVEVWRAHFATLFLSWPEVEAPAGLGERIERDVRDAPAAANDNSKLRFWQILSGVALLAAACMLFALVARAPAPAPIVLPAPQENAMPMVAALGGTDKNAAKAAAVYDRAKGEIRIGRTSFAPAGKTAQLWVIAGDGVPHSLGLLAPNGETKLRLPAGTRARVASGVTLAVSVEPLGGSPTALPTGPVVATGSLL